MSTTARSASSDTRSTPRWLFAAIAGLFGLVFAYAVWNAVGNLVASIQAAQAAHLQLSALGWFLWILAAALPIIIYVIAFVLAKRRGLLGVLLLFLAGLGLVAALWLDLVAYSVTQTASLVG